MPCVAQAFPAPVRPIRAPFTLGFLPVARARYQKKTQDITKQFLSIGYVDIQHMDTPYACPIYRHTKCRYAKFGHQYSDAQYSDAQCSDEPYTIAICGCITYARAFCGFAIRARAVCKYAPAPRKLSAFYTRFPSGSTSSVSEKTQDTTKQSLNTRHYAQEGRLLRSRFLAQGEKYATCKKPRNIQAISEDRICRYTTYGHTARMPDYRHTKCRYAKFGRAVF